MIFVKILFLGIITAVASLIVKQIKPEIAFFITLTGCILILFEIVALFSEIVETFLHLSDLTGIDTEVFQIVLKIIGIGYLTEFISNLCADSGLNSVADKILLGGKVVIMLVSLPIINTLIEIVMSLMDLF